MTNNNYIHLFQLFIFGLAIFWLASIFSACTKELPFPDVEETPKLVVNSLFSPEEFLEVHISETCHIQDQNCIDNFVENADVMLKDEVGNVLSSLTHRGNGIYRPSSNTIKHNTAYNLEVTHSNLNLGTISVKGNVPKEFECTLLGIEEEVIEERLVWAFDVEIKDNPDEENYYILEGSFDILNGQHAEGESEFNGYIEPHFGHFSNDPNAENNYIAQGFDYIAIPLRYVFLTDRNFNGQTYRTRVGVQDYDINDPGFEVIANIDIKSVSKDMYEYLKSVALYELSSGSIFSEPQQIFSNVEKGIGIFAGYTQHSFSIDLPKSQYSFPSNIEIVDRCTAPCEVTFSTDGGALLSYFWEFGDGETSTEPNPKHSYITAGDYQAYLSVRNGSGDSFGAEFSVRVN